MFQVLPEARRLAYLEVMGVESYFPCQMLPGAKPSILCETLPVIEETVLAEPDPQRQPQPQRATGEDTLRALMPDIDFAQKKPPKAAVPIKETAQTQSAGKPEAVRFNLRFFQVPGLAMIVDSSPDSFPEPPLQRFVANLLFAVSGLNDGWEGAIKTNLQQHLFRWPLVGNHQIEQGEGAAREAVTAAILANHERHSAPLIVLMGQAATDFGGGDYSGARVVSAQSVSHYLNTPQDKRELWQSLLASP